MAERLGRVPAIRALLVLLLLSTTWFGVTAQVLPLEVVSVRSVNTSDQGIRQASLNILRGITAAFEDANAAGGIGGRNVSLTAIDDEGSATLASEIAANMTKYVNTSSVLMLCAARVTDAIVANSALSGVPHFSPYLTYSSYFEPERRSMVHLKLPWAEEMRASMVYGVNSPSTRCKQFVIAYGTFAPLVAVVTTLNETLSRLGLPVPKFIVFPRDGPFDDSLTQIADAVYEHPRAQCVMVFHKSQKGPAVARVKQDPRYDGQVYFFVQSVNSDAISADTDPALLGDLYTSQMFPNPDNTEYAIGEVYKASLRRLAASSFPDKEKRLYGEGLPPGGQYPATFEGLEGYVSARFYLNTVKRVAGDLTHENILRAVYSAGSVSVEDLVFGPYIDSCSGGRTEEVFGSCWCNSGGKLIHTSIFDADLKKFVDVSDAQERYARPAVSLSSCGLEDTALQPYRFVLLPEVGNASTTEMAARRLLGKAIQDQATALYEKRTARYLSEAVVVSTATSTLANLTSIEERYLLDVIAFPTNSIAKLTSSVTRALVIAPMRPDFDLHHVALPEVIPGSKGEADNLVTVFPTRADAVHASFAYLRGRSIRLAFDPEIQQDAARSGLTLNLIANSAETFGVTIVESYAVVHAVGKSLLGIARDLPIIAVVRDNTTIREALSVSLTTEVVFAASELLVDAIIAEDKWLENPTSQNSRARVVSALSQYTDPAQSERTALSSYGMAVQSLLSQLTLSLDIPIAPAQITDVLYQNQYFTTEYGRFGPFSRELRCNKGLTRFYVHQLPLLYRLNASAAGVVPFSYDLGGCEVVYTSPADESSGTVPTTVIVILVVLIFALILMSVAVVKLCRKGCTTVTIRRFIQSPFMPAFLRLVFQLLDIITDAISCYIVINKNVDVVFTALFTLLTVSAAFANVYELLTTMLYLRFVLQRLTLGAKWGGGAADAGETPSAEHRDSTNPLDGDVDEEDRKGSSGPVIDFGGGNGGKTVLVLETSDTSHMQSVRPEQENPMVAKQLWEQRLVNAAVATLLLEDVPMCVMTTAALVEDSSEVFLFVSLIVSCVLLGTKLTSLQDGFMKFIKKAWRKSDDRRLSKLARELDENASAEDMRRLVDQFSDEQDCVAYANLLEEHNPDRYDALTDFGEHLVLQMDALEIDTSEYFAVVMQTVRANDATLGKSAARSGVTGGIRTPRPRSKDSATPGMASSQVSMVSLRRRLGEMVTSGRFAHSQLRNLPSGSFGSRTHSNRSLRKTPNTSSVRSGLPPLPTAAGASLSASAMPFEDDPRRGTAAPPAAANSTSFSDSERTNFVGEQSPSGSQSRAPTGDQPQPPQPLLDLDDSGLIRR